MQRQEHYPEFNYSVKREDGINGASLTHSEAMSSNFTPSIAIPTAEKPVKKRKQSAAASTSATSIQTNNNGADMSHSNTPPNDDDDSPKKKKKRKQVKRACINCHKSHAGCDDVRPCKRCISLGLEASCSDVEPRNNKRKSGFGDQSSQNSSTTQTTAKNEKNTTTAHGSSYYYMNNPPGSNPTYPPSGHYPLHPTLFPPSSSSLTPILGSPSMSHNSGSGSSGSPYQYHPYPPNSQRQLLPPPSSLIGSVPSELFDGPPGRVPSLTNPQNHLALINNVMMQQQLLIQALQKLESGGTLDPSITNNLIAGNQIIGQSLEHLPNRGGSIGLSEKSGQYTLPPPSSLSAPSPTLIPTVNTSSLLSPTPPVPPMNRTFSSSSLEGLLGPSTPTAATPLAHSVSTPLTLGNEVSTPSQLDNTPPKNIPPKIVEVEREENGSTSTPNTEHEIKENHTTKEDDVEDEYVGFFRKPTNDVDIIDDYFALFNSNMSDEGGYEENNFAQNDATEPSAEAEVKQAEIKTCILSKEQLSESSSGYVHIPSGEDTRLCVAVWKLNGSLFSANENFFTIFGIPSLTENVQVNFSSVFNLDSDNELKQIFSCRSDFFSKSIKLHKYSDNKEATPESIEGYVQAYVIRNSQGVLPMYISTHISVSK